MMAAVLFVLAVIAMASLAEAQAPAVSQETLRVELGRKLYFDKRLSVNRTTSCASCHDPKNGYGDGRPVAVGLINPATQIGKQGTRNSPTILGASNQRFQFWDGRAASLEEQAQGPIENPIEMGQQTVEQALARLPATYDVLFVQAFGRTRNRQDYATAMASFERTIVSRGAPADTPATLPHKVSAAAVRGAAIFNRSCATCHDPKNDYRGGFANNGYSSRTQGKDQGLAQARKNGVLIAGRGPGDRNVRAFKVPTLREVARTGPYMHDGGLKSLADVVAHYAGGGIFVSTTTGIPSRDPLIDPRVASIALDASQQRDLVQFLIEGLAGDYPKVEEPVLP